MVRKLSMPLILLLLVGGIMTVGHSIPLFGKQFLYSVSLSIKAGIMAILPIIIFGLLFKTAVSLGRTASGVIAGIILLVCAFNFVATFLSQFIGMLIYQCDISVIHPQGLNNLEPLWLLHYSAWIGNEKVLLLGFLGGFIATIINDSCAKKAAQYLHVLVSCLLHVITYIIPFFVIGFIVKLQHDGVMAIIFKDYSMIFLATAAAQLLYLCFLYLVGSHFNVIQAVQNFKNILPAGVAGFSTMSSAAAMPLTIIGAEENAANKNLVSAVIPATVNIHLVGDCFAIPIFAFAVLKSFGMVAPSCVAYLIFSCYFVLAKFSVAAIPGGGILVMLPILEKYLGFTSDMMSMITALYILFDPVITSVNVLGNGAFAKIVDNISMSTLIQKHDIDCNN